MSWRTEINGDVGLIMDGKRVVGSIRGHNAGIGPTAKQAIWRVEIMWYGHGGDITGRFDSLEKALCFIEGVEKGLDAVLGLSTTVQP